ncbi:MAG: hypothetical protein BWY21_01395 [Parcubacteria group bacterium ADurb.Bin216]|nr:MAG: hypothetical protein BWY21_01395 [Parcubacteria group bacterium ADurb.Bin216]
MIKKETRDKIVAQALKEIQFARIYKQTKVQNWQKNEDLYYAKKVPTNDSRANIELGRTQEFVHTLLSKIDNPLVFKFVKRKESQLKRVKRLNSLATIDRKNDIWDLKDLAGKKQAIIYGRAIYNYYADSIDQIYRPHLENVDVYDFLIDPSAGGLDIDRARYLGNFGIVKTRDELKTNKKFYISSEVEELLAGTGNNTQKPQEELNKDNRMYGNTKQKELQDEDKFKFWQWFTTYNGKRIYLLMTNEGKCIRCETLTDIFTPTAMFPAGYWPYWTWACFPDLTEFWTPSYLDFQREIFMAENVCINQMFDNAEAINKPQRKVQVGAIENMAELKYKKDGYIKVKEGIDINKAYQIVETPSIETPLLVFDKLEQITAKSSGVTDVTAGVADEDGKVGIYEGNAQAIADRFALLNKSYSFGYDRFAKLYQIGVRDNLTKKIAIDMIGPDGIETEEVSNKDIFKTGDDFLVMVENSNAEQLVSLAEKKAKLTFLSNNMANPVQSPKKAYEMSAKIVGLTEDDIKQLMDTTEYGNAELMSECARDIEDILDGKKIKPNRMANNAYKQKLVDYMKDHEEDMTDKQFRNMAEYIVSLEPIIMENEVRILEQTQPLPSGGAKEEININPPEQINEEQNMLLGNQAE